MSRSLERLDVAADQIGARGGLHLSARCRPVVDIALDRVGGAKPFQAGRPIIRDASSGGERFFETGRLDSGIRRA